MIIKLILILTLLFSFGCKKELSFDETIKGWQESCKEECDAQHKNPYYMVIDPKNGYYEYCECK